MDARMMKDDKFQRKILNSSQFIVGKVNGIKGENGALKTPLFEIHFLWQNQRLGQRFSP
jgi:hypothetical protein